MQKKLSRQFEVNTDNLTLTFKYGYLTEVITHGKYGQQDRKIPPNTIMFVSDMIDYVGTKKVPMFEMSQWLWHLNPDLQLSMVDENTIVMYNVKL